MAPSVKQRPQPTPFDMARLQTLTEPITMRVERVKGNAYQVMPLPVREGYNAPGQGFAQEEVIGFETWVVSTYGGGTYKFTATDSAGETMNWTQIFPLAQYPERYPTVGPDGQISVSPAGNATMASSTQSPVPVQLPPAMQPQAAPWPPPIGSWGAAPSPLAPPVQMPPTFGMPNPYGLPYGMPNQYPQFMTQLQRPVGGDETALKIQLVEQRYQSALDRMAEENRRMVEEMRRANETKRPGGDDIAQQRLDREREQRYNAEKEAEKARFDATLKSLEDRMSTRGQGSEEDRIRREEERSRREDERRREDARLEREREERRLEREEAREERHRQEEQRRLDREEQRRRDELMLEAMRNKGPDPMLQMMMEQRRSEAEAAREQARLNAEVAKEQARLTSEAARERAREQESLLGNLRNYMLSPNEVARMVKEASAGQDQFMRNMTGTFNDVFGTVRDWFTNMSQMMQGPGESPAVRVIEGGISSAKDMFREWQKSKAQTEVARANAVAAANQPHWEPPPPVVAQQQQPMTPANGASAAPVNGSTPANGANGHAVESNGSSAGLGNAAAAPTEPAAPPKKVRLGGKTDEEWFGPALPDILKLREGAYHFYESARTGRMMPDGKRPEGIGPDQIADLIVQAAHIITSQNIPGVPAFDYLFKNQMYPQLIEIMLPDLPAEGAQGFRDHVAQFLYAALKPGSTAPTSIEEAYGDDGDGEDDDGEDVQA